MYMDSAFKTVLATSLRAAWQIDDVLPPGAQLDLTRPLLPERLARTNEITGLRESERLVLNHIRGHEYIAMFGLVEEFILPFVLDHARPQLNDDDWRTRALLNFASEEAKHIQLFKQFSALFARDFGEACPTIGPTQALADRVLAHSPLAVAMIMLQIEWMTQVHYLETVRDEKAIDPLFRSLLKHHWIEEASHAKLDALLAETLAANCDAEALTIAFQDYIAILAMLDDGLREQSRLNLRTLERWIGREFTATENGGYLAAQHAALRFTYLGSGMTHPRFRATAMRVWPNFMRRLDALAQTFS